MQDGVHRRPEVQQLLENIKAALPRLVSLLEAASDHWGYEDPVYRFYHQSWKVYGLQGRTLEIVDALAALMPGRALNPWFARMVADGTGKTFSADHNQRWLEVTRPIVEAFFHARYFLQMVCKYGGELDAPPVTMPSGWAAVLYLYDLR